MNNENQPSEVKTQIKTSKSSQMLGWIVSVFFLLIGFAGLQGDATIGTIFIFIGLKVILLLLQASFLLIS